MKIKDITQYLEAIAPPIYQEEYDNSGLIVGDAAAEVNGVLICLDSVEAVIDEAVEKGCNLVIAHHPIVFKGLKRFTGRNYVERVVMKAIRNDIAIYAIHTNLDNVSAGVNARIAERLGLEDTRILAPKGNLEKLAALIPAGQVERVKEALFEAGGGVSAEGVKLSYASVGAMSEGVATSPRVKLEMLFPVDRRQVVVNSLHHHLDGPFMFDISDARVVDETVGGGMIGRLPKPVKAEKFLRQLKKKMGAGCVKHTALPDGTVSRIAVCGGAGGFLLRQAITQGADVFVTSDYKYHEFFDAEGRIVIADIGHYESEQFTINLIYDLLNEKFTTFALLKTTVDTNPVKYL